MYLWCSCFDFLWPDIFDLCIVSEPLSDPTLITRSRCAVIDKLLLTFGDPTFDFYIFAGIILIIWVIIFQIDITIEICSNGLVRPIFHKASP